MTPRCQVLSPDYPKETHHDKTAHTWIPNASRCERVHVRAVPMPWRRFTRGDPRGTRDS